MLSCTRDYRFPSFFETELFKQLFTNDLADYQSQSFLLMELLVQPMYCCRQIGKSRRKTNLFEERSSLILSTTTATSSILPAGVSSDRVGQDHCFPILLLLMSTPKLSSFPSLLQCR